MTAKSESRSAVIALRSQAWILRIEEKDLSTSVVSRGKMARIFSRSLTFGKKMLSACYMSVRRPRWINNTALPVASIGSFMETVPDFRKITGRVSDGPTFHAILEQVPGTDLEYIVTDFLKERLLRRTLLVGSGRDAPPGNFWIFFSLELPTPSFLAFWVIQTAYCKCSTWNFFLIQNISIYDRFS